MRNKSPRKKYVRIFPYSSSLPHSIVLIFGKSFRFEIGFQFSIGRLAMDVLCAHYTKLIENHTELIWQFYLLILGNLSRCANEFWNPNIGFIEINPILCSAAWFTVSLPITKIQSLHQTWKLAKPLPWPQWTVASRNF